MKRILPILVLFGAIYGCRPKKYPDPSVENDPIFYFRGNVNNAPVYIEAGIDDYYVYSSYGQEATGNYYFTSDLKQINCASCNNSLRIQINDYKFSALGASVKIDSSLGLSSYAFYKGPGVPSYSARFTSSYNRATGSYRWDFGDGTAISTQKDPDHVFASPGVYNVCLTVTDPNSCVNSICNKITVGKNYRASIVSNAAANTLTFTPTVNGGTAPFTYLWNFGDGKTDSLSNAVHTYKYRGSYPVNVRIVDANNDTVVAYYNAVTQTDASSCAANYSTVSVTELPSIYNALSKVIIRYTDGNGTVYTSQSALQPSSSYFQIISVENYENNESGFPTKKLHVRFKCNVYNGLTAIPIDNGEAIICVAYK